MTDEEISDLRKYRWMKSRIPARDALVAFVPDASAPDPLIEEMQVRLHQSRWYPVPGGHRVLMLHDGGEYDAKRFQVEAGAWDHEHCDVCEEQIPAMTLCYVTEEGSPYVLLCESCYKSHVAAKSSRR